MSKTRQRGKTKKDLVKAVMSTVGIRREDAELAVDIFFEEMRGALKRGETIWFKRLGKFKTKKPTEHNIRNSGLADRPRYPLTVVFKPSDDLSNL